LEEKRKKNEPLNKEALEKMKKIYNADSFMNNNEIKEKLKSNPELGLIGMDPKAILAKHQNDFTQFLLRNLTLDELRAIRASLPKFRNDQKRQQDWVEILEAKIDQMALNPPAAATPKAPKAATLKIKVKPPLPSAGGAGAAAGGGGLFAELLAKRKALGDNGVETSGDAPPPPKTPKKEDSPTPSKPGTIKLAPNRSPLNGPPPPLAPGKAPPPPPPPPPFI